ncbi:MAG TPA: hypothetical protein VF395_08145, partial [Polyangiaceae bacterium]
MTEKPVPEVSHAGDGDAGDRAARARAPRASLFRIVGAGAVLVAGTAFFLHFVHRFYPIQHWLFWIYAKAWVAAGGFFVSCLVAGNALLVRTLRRTLPLGEHLVTSFALGAFAFFLLMFGFGVLGLVRPWLFFVVPSLLIAAGARPAHRIGKRLYRHLRALMRKPRRPLSPLEILVGVAGCVGVLLLYLPTLTPANISYDARWYHIPIAEHYVALGAIVKFQEGWFLGAYPHLASLYYMWALLLPKSSYFDKVELIAHLEVLFFLVTLVGIPAIVRLLLPRTRAPVAWAAMFLFPGIFAYDSSLIAGADHIAALWAIPLFTLLVRLLKTSSRSFAGLFAVMVAGALDTKVTAITIFLPPVLVVLAVFSFRLVRPARGGSRRTPA